MITDGMLWYEPLCVLTHERVQRDTMATMVWLQHSPDRMQLSLDLMAVLGAALVVVGGRAGGGVGRGGVGGAG